MKKVCLILTFLLPLILFSQNNTRYSDVYVNYDINKLLELKEIFDIDFLEKQKKILEFLKLNPSIHKSYTKEGITFEIIDVIDGIPIYNKTDNLGSAQTIRTNHLYFGGSLGLNIQGQNMTGGVWDGGSVRTTHQEFSGKVFNSDASNVSDHGTHVAGTFFASGVNSSVRGIAFNAFGVSYDWNSDLSEMTMEAIGGLLVSNHSYGAISQFPWQFGAYNTQAQQFDIFANNAPYYTVVKSAGNDRNDFSHAVNGPQITNKSGYDLLKGFSVSKNIITVGAVTNVPNYIDESSVVMSSFSSWGPTDDGRIKPDIVAKGVSVLSTTSTTDSSIGTLSGTSMASPSVAGACLLLQQHYKNIRNSYMLSSTLKGLIIHSADEAGFYPGPDYQFGWGLLNSSRAAQIITNSLSGNQSKILEQNLINNTTQTINVFSDGTQPLMVTLAWNDPASPNVNNSTVDPSTLYLVNDLDVRVTRNNELYFPWTLIPSTPSEPALRNSDNFRDNVEKIQIDAPEPGSYSIIVSHKGNLLNGNQIFSMVITGINQTLSNQTIANNEFAIYPNPSNGLFTIATEGFESKILEMFDIQGRSVFSTALNSNLNDINVSHLPKGVYMARLIAGDQVTTKKIVIR